jgi:glycosyltransferase involved in cell wall biosynthesis/peptidoglycan/xylan/chitin deacetylase (PgdA/CDA1 family)
MKIWHVGAAPNPFRVDGVSRTVWLLSTEQARLGHEVSLILDGEPTPEAHEMAAAVGLKLHDLSSGAYANQVEELLGALRPDVVHMHSVFIPRQAVLGKVLRKAGVPYVITPHAGLAPQVLARGRVKKAVYSIVRERPRFMHAAAVALVTPAEEKAVRAFIPRYRGIVRWMPNPVEVSMLDPARWHGLAGQKRLVFLGRFDVLVKGIDILIEIARLLPDVKVDLYGTEDLKTLDWLKKLKENLPPNVSFNDPIFGKDKAEILAGASIYIQPSRWEGFPVSVAECLYLGVPSSITESLDLAQLFRQHDLGLVLSLTPETAAQQLRVALRDGDRLREWSARGREFALAHFYPSAAAQKYINLYDEVARVAAAAATSGAGVAPATPAALAPGGTNGHATLTTGTNGHARPSIARRLMPAGVRNAVKQNISRFIERGSELAGGGKNGAAAARAVVLCYHSIGDGENGLTLAPEQFRQQLTTLRDLGFAFQTFGDFVDRVMRWGLPQTNVAVVTFDDGFEDNFFRAAPILAEMNVPATFFITSGLLERDPAVVDRFKRLTRFESATFLSPEQLRQMHAAGLEIGAHTHGHANLARLAPKEARWEIGHSKQLIEQAVGAPVRSFAYPFGKRHIHYLPETVDFVREAGYRGAGAVAFRAVSSSMVVRIFEIPRFFVTRDDAPAQFRQKVAGHFDWVGRFQERSPAWLKALVSPEDRY